MGHHEDLTHPPAAAHEERVLGDDVAVAAPRPGVQRTGAPRAGDEPLRGAGAHERRLEHGARVGDTQVRQHEPQDQQRLGAVADRQQHGLGGRVLRLVEARDVGLDAPPVLAPPQQRLREAHGLDAPGRDRLRAGLEQPVPQAQAVGRLRDPEVELPREPAPEVPAGAEQGRQGGEQRTELARAHRDPDHAHDAQGEHDDGDRPHERRDQPGGRDRDELPLWRLGRLRLLDRAEVHPGRARQQAVAQPLGRVLAQVGDLHGRVACAGDLDPQLRQPEEPGQQRLDHRDPLDPVEPRRALLAEQHPGLQVHGLRVHGVARHPPGQARVAEADEHGDAERPDDRTPAGALDDLLHPVDRGADLLDDDRQQHREDLPPLDSRGDGVDAAPDEIRAHSPASRASPRAASRSRRRAASAGTRPGIEASLLADAVCSCTRATPHHRSSGPACTSTNCIRP